MSDEPRCPYCETPYGYGHNEDDRIDCCDGSRAAGMEQDLDLARGMVESLKLPGVVITSECGAVGLVSSLIHYLCSTRLDELDRFQAMQRRALCAETELVRLSVELRGGVET